MGSARNVTGGSRPGPITAPAAISAYSAWIITASGNMSVLEGRDEITVIINNQIYIGIQSTLDYV